MFLGTYQYNLDAKGRVFIPAKLKEKLGDEFIVAKSMDPCIAIYSTETWQNYVAKLSALPEIKARMVKRFVFSSANEAAVDTQGRVLIPQPLREYARLTKELTIIGDGDHIEIWDPNEYERVMSQQTEEEMQQVLIEQGF